MISKTFTLFLRKRSKTVRERLTWSNCQFVIHGSQKRHVSITISQKTLVEVPKNMVSESVLQWSKTDVVRSHGYLSGAFPLIMRRNVCCRIIKRGKESRGRRAEWFSRLRIACVNVASALTENWSKPKTVLAPRSDFSSLSAESYEVK